MRISAPSLMALLAVACVPRVPESPAAPSSPPPRPVPVVEASAPPAVEPVAAVDAGPPPVAALAPVVATRATPAAASIHWSGRTVPTDAGVRFDWPGVSFITSFEGRALDAVVDTFDGGIAFEVEIDDGAPKRLELLGGVQRYPLAEGLKKGVHTARVTRTTEGMYGGVSTLVDVSAPGGRLVETPRPWAHRIELVGDSLSSGFGILGVHKKYCPKESSQQRFAKSYGALVARAFNAELQAVVVGGWGLTQGWGEPKTDKALPLVYGRALYTDATPSWDFTSWVPDAVVLNVGTNDLSTGATREDFEKAYRAFVAQLRVQYGPVPLFLIAGSSTQEIVEGLAAELHDANAHVVPLLLIKEEGFRCWHPTEQTHARWAAELTAAIEQTLGWKTKPAKR